jgi:UDP-glucose 4-epimerase
MNLLITGVAGFIGSNLAERLLKENFRVIGIDNLSSGVFEQIPNGVEFHKADIRDYNVRELFTNVDYVFHLAAKNCISDCQIDPLETTDVNIKGTVNIFEASRNANVKKIIYAESSAIYEDSNILPTPETEMKPNSFYAISKYVTNIFSNAYNKFYNLNFTALRYFCVYGPRQDYRRTIPPVFSAFIINLLKNKQPIIFGTGEKRRDFVYVDDVNDFHIKCIYDEKTTGNVYNLGYGKNYSINEIYSLISKLLEKNIGPEYRDDIPGEAFENLADINEAMKIGWYPKIDLETGLRKSIEYIKHEINNGKI